MKFDRDIDFRVHIGYDNQKDGEATKAQIIAKHLKPHVKQQIRQWEKLARDFLTLTLEELKDVFNETVKE